MSSSCIYLHLTGRAKFMHLYTALLAMYFGDHNVNAQSTRARGRSPKACDGMAD